MDLPGRRLSPAEYLALEAVSPDRLEYRDGLAVALTLPAKNHALITGTLAVTTGVKARAKGCRFFGENAKVVTPAGDRLIPDFIVTATRVTARTAPTSAPRMWSATPGSSSRCSRRPPQRTTSLRNFPIPYVPELTHFVAIDSRRRAVYLGTRRDDGIFPLVPVDRLMLPTLGEHGLTSDEIYHDTTVPMLRNIRLPRS